MTTAAELLELIRTLGGAGARPRRARRRQHVDAHRRRVDARQGERVEDGERDFGPLSETEAERIDTRPDEIHRRRRLAATGR